jgi:hypothetical protein
VDGVDAWTPDTGIDAPEAADPAVDPAADGLGESGVDAEVAADADLAETGIDAAPAGPFTLVDLTDVGDVNAMAGWGDRAIWAVGSRGLALRYDGFGFVPDGPDVDADLYGVAGEGDFVVAVGAAGTVAVRSAGAWTVLPPPADVELRAAGVTGPDDFRVAGRGGVLYRWLAGEWVKENSGVTADLFGMYVSPGGGAAAVGAHGTLVELQGTAWVTTQVAGSATALHAIWRAPDGRRVAVGERGTVAYDDGMSWRLLATNDTYDPPRDLHGVFGFAAGDAYAVGDGGVVMRVDVKKGTLMTVAGPYNVFADLAAVAGVAAADGSRKVFAAGRGSLGLALDGKVWKDQPLGVTADLNGAIVNPDGSLTAVGGHGLILTLRGGRQRAAESGTDADLNAISESWVVGEGGTLLLRVSGGAVPLATWIHEDLTDVWAAADATWVTGADGSLLRVAGPKVETYAAFPGDSLHAVCVSAGRTFVAGRGGRMWVDQGDGAGFGEVATGVAADLWDMLPATDLRVMAVGDAGAILSCDASACSRIHEDPTTFLYGVGPFASGTLAVGWAGSVLRLEGGAVTALDAGTHRVLRSVADGSNGVAYLVGQGGTLLEYRP